MLETKTIIDYKGSISFDTIELLLNELISTHAYKEMKKRTRKRIYCVFVESIENICKYSANNISTVNGKKRESTISVTRQDDNYFISAGNIIANGNIESLRTKIDRVNKLDRAALKALYEDTINQESNPGDSGAGLGLITIALRTEDDLMYRFTSLDNNHSFFEIQITVN